MISKTIGFRGFAYFQTHPHIVDGKTWHWTFCQGFFSTRCIETSTQAICEESSPWTSQVVNCTIVLRISPESFRSFSDSKQVPLLQYSSVSYVIALQREKGKKTHERRKKKNNGEEILSLIPVISNIENPTMIRLDENDLKSKFRALILFFRQVFFV